MSGHESDGIWTAGWKLAGHTWDARRKFLGRPWEVLGKLLVRSQVPGGKHDGYTDGTLVHFSGQTETKAPTDCSMN